MFGVIVRISTITSKEFVSSCNDTISIILPFRQLHRFYSGTLNKIYKLKNTYINITNLTVTVFISNENALHKYSFFILIYSQMY